MPSSTHRRTARERRPRRPSARRRARTARRRRASRASGLVPARPDRRVARPDPLDQSAARVTPSQLALFRPDPVDQLLERVGELLDALRPRASRRRRRSRRRPREVDEAAAAPRRRLRAPCRRGPRRDPGTPRSSRAASCSRCPGRSAPRRRCTSRYAGFFVEVEAQRRRCGGALRRRGLPARASRMPPASARRRASRSRSRACPQLRVADLLQPAVGLRVDARDEEARDRRDSSADRRPLATSRSSPRR